MIIGENEIVSALTSTLLWFWGFAQFWEVRLDEIQQNLFVRSTNPPITFFQGNVELDGVEILLEGCQYFVLRDAVESSLVSSHTKS